MEHVNTFYVFVLIFWKCLHLFLHCLVVLGGNFGGWSIFFHNCTYGECINTLMLFICKPGRFDYWHTLVKKISLHSSCYSKNYSAFIARFCLKEVRCCLVSGMWSLVYQGGRKPILFINYPNNSPPILYSTPYTGHHPPTPDIIPLFSTLSSCFLQYPPILCVTVVTWSSQQPRDIFWSGNQWRELVRVEISKF